MISELIKVICAKSIVRTVSTSSLFFIKPITFEKATPIKSPNMIPQNTIEKNFQKPIKAASGVNTPPEVIIARTTKKRATAVPSLKRLSHSNIMVSLLGAQSFLKIESTATGSVAEISTQNKRQIRNGTSTQKYGIIGNRKYSQTETKEADISRPKIASAEIDFQFKINCL